MRYATSADGVRVAFDDLGGSGPPLLFAHATGFHGQVWRPVAEELAGEFHCWTFDERGHGDTPPPANGVFDWNGFALDALAVVDEVGLERPYGVGHSAGGAGLLLAELSRPGTFGSLYAYEPIVPPTGEDGKPMLPSGSNPLAAGARRRREVFESRDAAYANYASKPPLSVFAPAALRAYVDHGFEDLPDGDGVRLKCRGESEARTYEMSIHHGAYSRLGSVTCPTTVACGSDTDTFGPSVMAMLAERLPLGRVDVLPGLGHFGPMQDPAAIAESIRRAFA
jgi:pimeloyl-ACP methyl ester carboxylesterase